MRLSATRNLVAVLVAALVLVGAQVAGAQDAPAVSALTEGDAYVSPRALGPASGEAEAELAQAAAAINADGRDVKLAIVPGPVGAPSMRAYTRRLRRDLDYSGTLAVTAPRRPTIAVGPLPPATITTRLRSPLVVDQPDPVERVIAAGELATPEPDASGATREILLLLGLAVLGAAWAVAWGLRRERRGARAELAEIRGWAVVCLDAIDARADELWGRATVTPRAGAHLESSQSESALARSAVLGADRMSALEEALPGLRRAFDQLELAATDLDEPLDVDDPFEGLCGVDPAHGPASEVAEVKGIEGEEMVCPACAQARRQGHELERRMIPVEGRPVPFDQMPSRVLTGG
jgi:hypothetical protein